MLVKKLCYSCHKYFEVQARQSGLTLYCKNCKPIRGNEYFRLYNHKRKNLAI